MLTVTKYMLTLQGLDCVEGSCSNWWALTELSHRNPNTLNTIQRIAKPVLLIQFSCEEKHTSTNCEQSEQGRASATKNTVSPYRQTRVCYWKLREQNWLGYVYSYKFTQRNIQLVTCKNCKIKCFRLSTVDFLDSKENCARITRKLMQVRKIVHSHNVCSTCLLVCMQPMKTCIYFWKQNTLL